jgi:hypothetical protein
MVMAVMAVMDMGAMMAPVPTTVSIISIVAGSHDNRRGVDDSRRWGDDHGWGCDDDRKPDADGDIYPRVGLVRQKQSCASQEGAETYNP